MALSRTSSALFGGMLAAAVAVSLVAVPLASADPNEADTRHHVAGTRVHTMPGDNVFPEGVAFDSRTGYFYVGATSNGTIFRGRLHQSEMEVFLPGGADGRSTAIGMKVDDRGRLYISGGPTGQMFVYDTRTRELIRRFDTRLRENTFINDVAFDRAGNAYFTDSMTPILWRVPASAVHASDTVGEPEAFLDFEGTPVEYVPGEFNLNGITPTLGGKRLLVVQSNTGQVFRIDVGSRAVEEVPIDGGPVTAGDGLVTVGRLLLVVRNSFGTVETVALTGHRGSTRGRVVARYTDEEFRFPTTAAYARGRLLVVNAQFDRRGTPEGPVLPFTVADVPLWRVILGLS